MTGTLKAMILIAVILLFVIVALAAILVNGKEETEGEYETQKTDPR